MYLSAGSRRRIYFGEFQLDLDTAELRNNGNKSNLVGQPLQILTELLERPGELVTREELKKKLWPDDTFVDFDQSLNKAVNRLREALKDSAEDPRFIETLPRRGYRFIGSLNHPTSIALPSRHDPPLLAVSPEPTAQSESREGNYRASPRDRRSPRCGFGIISGNRTSLFAAFDAASDWFHATYK
jgi:DNA-binding winged helix-turn-helix (wHTH) protein